MIDYYRILEVQPHASPEVIEKAYRALSLKHHPDRQSASRHQQATREMQRLNEAYTVLSDPVRRRDYDLVREAARARHERETKMLHVFMDDGLVGLFRMWVKEGMRQA